MYYVIQYDVFSKYDNIIITYFLNFVNKKELMHFSYQRYIENQIREVFGFAGTPIRIYIRERKEEE